MSTPENEVAAQAAAFRAAAGTAPGQGSPFPLEEQDQLDQLQLASGAVDTHVGAGDQVAPPLGNSQLDRELEFAHQARVKKDGGPFYQESPTEKPWDGAVWNPWSSPIQPTFWQGMGFDEDTAYLGPMYRVLEAAGNGAAKGEALLGGVYHGLMEGESAVADALGSKYLQSDAASGLEEAQAVEQDAQARVKAMTPDPATTGTAVQLLNGTVSGLYRATVGALAGGPVGSAVLLGGSEGVSRYEQLRAQGVDPVTAGESAGTTGTLQGLGALLPGGVGSTLVTRLLSGAGINAAMGMAGRYADHAILAHGGYQAMADQQQVWDGSQLAADLILGAGFGGLAHLHANAEEGSPEYQQLQEQRRKILEQAPAWGQATGAEDAARVVELASADRRTAPGVPVDPQAAAAHQAALEKATADLLAGEPVNVADTGVDQAEMLARPEQPGAELGRQVIADSFRKAGIGEAEGTLADLEAQLAARFRGETVQTPAREPSAATEAEARAPVENGPGAAAAPPAETVSPEGELAGESQAIAARVPAQVSAPVPYGKPWDMAVLDRPDMQIPGRFADAPIVDSPTLQEVGPSEAASQTVNAGDALRAANANVEQAQKTIPPLFEGVANCVARRGL